MESSYWDSVLRRRIARRRFLAGAMVAGVAGTVIACGGSGNGGNEGSAPSGGRATGDARYGGTINVGIGGEPRGGFDPHTGFGGEEHQFLYLVTDQLIGYDSQGQLDQSVSLAERWELPDQLKVVLKLRSGVKFHDGAELTAQDIKWNLDRILDPATAATPRSDLAAIDSVQAVSKNEITITLKEPSAPLLTAFGDRGGMIISPAAFEKIGKDQFIRKPVGTGPFTLKEWVSDAFMTLNKNPTYWRKSPNGGAFPYLDAIKFEFIPEAAVRVAALESGQSHLLAGTPATDVGRLDTAPSLQSAKFVGASTGMWYINHDFAPLDNVWFRRAVSSAMDRATYIKNFLTGEEPLATGLLTPVSWAHDKTVQNYNYDSQKVKDYLQRSGIPQSQWRIKAQPQGSSISEGEQFFEAALKSFGITPDWNRPETGGSRLHLYKGQGADGTAAMLLSGWTMRVDPDGSVGQFYLKNGAYNSGQAAVPEVEPLVVKARQTYDQNQRKVLYSEIQKKAVENVYSHILMHYTIGRSHASKKVGNLQALFGGEGKPRYANLWLAS